MADPATLALIATIGSAAVGGIGAIEQGRAASQAAAYSAQVQANNAKIAQQNAEFKGAEGETNAAASQMKTRQQVAAIAASQAANGIDINNGSAVGVRQSAAELGELDAINIRSNAAREAYGFQTQAASDTAQSVLDKSASKNDMTAGIIGGASTFLSGAGNAASNFAKFQQTKSFDPTSTIFDMTTN